MGSRYRAWIMAAAAFLAAAGVTAWSVMASGPQVIKITAKRYEFSRPEITVKKGVPIVIEITALDRPHGFSLPDFDVRGDAMPGETTRVVFTPDKAGTFDFLCDLFCGDLHGEMSGKLIVTE
ncbi:MAG: cytochrome c oxidase subunit II [Rhodospirillales bacterium]|nr:cytochrome c oxidase subunit II [Rhodospirillales bacterium]MSP79970.1 cytochrome c oxidase subunit II [Rhodospirillales bacterium]